MNTSEKLYINLQLITDSTGYAHPLSIILEDGHTYDIERIKAFRPSNIYTSVRCDCYTVIIDGKERHLYYEPVDHRFGGRQGRWFLVKS